MLYEDDYEIEAQPANIRDRVIPGKNVPHDVVATPRRREPRSGPGPGTGTGTGTHSGPRRHEAPAHVKGGVVPESAFVARDLLAELLTKMGVSHVEIAYHKRPEGEYLEVDAPDLAMLIGKHGATLEAINLIFNNILNAGVRNNRHYFTIDAEGYRARRAEKLRELAYDTRERCLAEKKPIKLEPMLPSERKIVHIVLAEEPGVRTESEGEEPERRLVVYPV